jgi:hypothetical protein
VTLDHKTEKFFYLLDILYTHQEKQLWFSENFPEVHRLRDSQFC